MTNKNTPKERRIILKHADDPNYSNRIGCYLREGGYEMLRKALKMKPEEIVKKFSNPEFAVVEGRVFRQV